MNQTTNQVTATKTEIVDLITNDPIFRKILKAYQTTRTEGFKWELKKNEYKNGLVDVCYGITIDEALIAIILPIFSTEKTITWNNSYLKSLRTALPANFQKLEDHELVALIKCPLFFYDKYTGNVQYLSMVSLPDFIANGSNGKNGFSKYFWNDKLPNPWNILPSKIRSDIFVLTLPTLSNKELKSVCLDYATKMHKKFADTTQRSEMAKIKNIALGLYAQLKTYLWMKDSGYDVTMEWLEGDDLGIDITYKVNGMEINIDVKSTKTDSLKISKNRKETDFYAVCNWNKSEPQLLGFLFKYHFFGSDYINTTAPLKKNDMYTKTLAEISNDLVTADKMFAIAHNYKMLRMKRGERLFNAD